MPNAWMHFLDRVHSEVKMAWFDDESTLVIFYCQDQLFKRYFGWILSDLIGSLKRE